MTPGVSCETPEVRSQFNTLVFEFWLKNNSEPRLQLKEKVYLESHKGRKSWASWDAWAQEIDYRSTGRAFAFGERKAMPGGR